MTLEPDDDPGPVRRVVMVATVTDPRPDSPLARLRYLPVPGEDDLDAFGRTPDGTQLLIRKYVDAEPQAYLVCVSSGNPAPDTALLVAELELEQSRVLPAGEPYTMVHLDLSR